MHNYDLCFDMALEGKDCWVAKVLAIIELEGVHKKPLHAGLLCRDQRVKEKYVNSKFRQHQGYQQTSGDGRT